MTAGKEVLVLVCGDCPRAEGVRKKDIATREGEHTHIHLGPKGEPPALDLV